MSFSKRRLHTSDLLTTCLSLQPLLGSASTYSLTTSIPSSLPGNANLTTLRSEMGPSASRPSLAATVARRAQHMSTRVDAICTSNLWRTVNWRLLDSLHATTSPRVSIRLLWNFGRESRGSTNLHVSATQSQFQLFFLALINNLEKGGFPAACLGIWQQRGRPARISAVSDYNSNPSACFLSCPNSPVFI